MSSSETTELVPIRIDADGVIRIGGTRVTLDTLVAAFEAGATPEEIVERYPTLALADVYMVIAYYLRRRTILADYFARRQQSAGRIRSENEGRFDPSGVRERLLARRR